MLCSLSVAKYPIPFGRHLLLLERINVGGMAEVFRAKAFGVEGFERVVAVKRILPTLAEDQEFISMFVDEARIAAHLTHQNVVQIYELGKDDDTYFISMEYVAGRDLRQILDRQKRLGTPMDPTTASFIVSRVCEALDYAHRKRDPAGRDLGIIHRDVTPQNVILSYEGEVKLCDFGIAKAATRVSKTQVGVLKGKFAYMAPEQVQGKPVDRRSDIFALGVVFYEMLTGERLFIGDSDYATLEAVRVADIPPPRTINPALSPALESILTRMLARDPNERYAWASDVQEDLLKAMIDSGELYQTRQLRGWMQASYAAAIKAENAKMEGFMRLRRPSRLAPNSPISQTDAPISEADAPPEIDQNPTADYPALPQHVLDALREANEDTDARADTNEPVDLLGDSPLGRSPVSNLFGTPQVDDSEPQSDQSMVRPATVADAPPPAPALKTSEVPLPDLSAMAGLPEAEDALSDDDDTTAFRATEAEDDERTVFDAYSPPPENETLLGDRVASGEVDAAQQDLQRELESPGLPTIDGMAVVDATGGGDQVAVEDTLHGMFVTGDINDRTAVQPIADPVDFGPVFSSDDATPFAGLQRPGAPSPSETETTAGMEVQSPLPATVGRGLLRKAPVKEVNPGPSSGLGPVSRPGLSGALGASGAPGLGGGGPGGMAESNNSTLSIDDASPAEAPRLVWPVDAASLRLEQPAVIAAIVGVFILLIAFVFTAFQSSEASLKVLSEPVEGVPVFVDGELVGTTPVKVPSLSIGQHRVHLEAPGYRRYTQTIRIQSARPHTMMVPLERSPPSKTRVKPSKPTRNRPKKKSIE